MNCPMDIKEALREWAQLTSKDHTDLPAAITLAVEYIEQLEKERDEFKAVVDGVKSIIDSDPLNMYVFSQKTLAEHNAEVIDNIKFPTMLRKMWSGGEVQAWLKEEADLLRQKVQEAQCPNTQ